MYSGNADSMANSVLRLILCDVCFFHRMISIKQAGNTNYRIMEFGGRGGGFSPVSLIDEILYISNAVNDVYIYSSVMYHSGQPNCKFC